MRWFNQRKVVTRFLIIGLFILPFLLGLAGVGSWGVFQVNDLLKEFQEQQLPSVYDLGQAIDLIDQVHISYRDAVIETDPAKITQIITTSQETFKKARQSWELYKSLPATNAEIALWPKVEDNWNQWNTFLEEVFRLAQINTSESNAQAYKLIQANSLGGTLANNLLELSRINYDDANKLASTSNDTLVTVLIGIAVTAIGVVIIVVVAGLVLARSIINLTNTQDRLNRQINQALSNIEGKRQLGERVSQQLKSMTAELNGTSNQQASGSQQQATALTQIVSSVSELSQTAQNIATNSKRIDQVAEKVLTSTRAVEEVTLAVTQAGEQGQQAMHKTIATNQKVNQFYQALVKLLSELFEQSTQLKEVNNLMRQLSDETHLLSLNAAIEAAGAGQYGERFGVVASAVKELADRSVDSSKEVTQIVSKLQEQIQQAVMSAESGQKETEVAVVVAQETGAVIGELVGAIKHSAQEVRQIGIAMRNLNELTQEITFATTQQSSASAQTVESLQEIGIIAKQNAGASIQVNATVHELEEIAHELNLTLAA
jgi:methyl-accepting chemotaxis protein